MADILVVEDDPEMGALVERGAAGAWTRPSRRPGVARSRRAAPPRREWCRGRRVQGAEVAGRCP
ncbi:hypothetical protein Cus16_0445 [Curtobacterium sp. ER1/6]|nr:hypothetical protein Cus16_0445 [Curtobacterium sp. ER1/6]